MADICTELRKQLHELDVLRKSCGSVLLREGMESDAAKKTIGKFDTLAEELRDVVVLYKQPFDERLDNIERKMEDKKNLTKWECWVLYGIDKYLKDNNIFERERRKNIVKRWRSDEEKKQDLAYALDIIPDHISVIKEEALLGTIRYHYDDLNLGKLTSINTKFTMPEVVGGDLNLGDLTSIDTDLTMPEVVGRNLNLGGLTSIKTNLTMPKEVGGHLNLGGLTSIDTELTMPKKIGGYLKLLSLTSIDTELTLPEEVGGLDLGNLTTTHGIINWPIKIRNLIFANPALPDNEREELEKWYPGKVRYE